MKNILFILVIYALAILLNESTKETKEYKDFYFSVLHKEYTITENRIIDATDNNKKDSLLHRLREINSLLNER